MPRFGLQPVGIVDYRTSLPQRDPNNAIWPRISAFAKMLHDMSWDDKETRPPDQDELDAIAATESEEMNGYTPAAEEASEQMKGYKPNTPEQDVEAMVDEQQRRVNDNYTGGHRDDSVDIERQKAMADSGNIGMDDFIKNFDPKTASKEDIRKMQRIVAPADAKLSNPDYKPGVHHFDDGSWGKASKQAFEKYLRDNPDLATEDFIKGFNPKTASKEDIKYMQRIVAPTDAPLSDPDYNPRTSYFDDGSWGKASQQAFEDYLKQWGYQ